MGEHIKTGGDSANMLRFMPIPEVFVLSEKLNLPSERLLSVAGNGVAERWFLKHRGQAMWKNGIDVGLKLSLLPEDLLNCQGLAQDLDISIPTVEATIKAYSVLGELGDGDHGLRIDSLETWHRLIM